MVEKVRYHTTFGKYCTTCQRFYPGEYLHCPICGPLAQMGIADALVTDFNDLHGGEGWRMTTVSYLEYLATMAADAKNRAKHNEMSWSQGDPKRYREDTTKWVLEYNTDVERILLKAADEIKTLKEIMGPKPKREDYGRE